MGDNLLLRGTGDAEVAVVGAMLIDERCIPAVLASGVGDGDFADGTCRTTFRAVKKLFLANRPVDPVTVVDAIQGGDTYRQWVTGVMEATPTAANVESYCTIVRDGGMLRRMRTLAEELVLCGERDSAEDLARKIMAETTVTDRMPRMSGKELAEDFVARMRSTKPPEYLPWGFPTLDRAIKSELGDFNILGGYSSAGKTLLSIQMALSMAKRFRVGYYSLETRPEKMADRLFAHLSGTPLTRIKSRTLTDEDWPRLAEAVSGFTAHCPFDVIRAGGSSVEDVMADALSRRYQVIFVDYIQQLRVPSVKTGDRYALVTAVSAELHLFAQQHNVAVVGLAQLSRPEKTKDGKVPPDMHSLRESGQLEQDADSILLVYPKDANDNRSNRIIKIAKNKDGPRAMLEVAFDGATQTMTECTTDRAVATHYSEIGRTVKSKNHREAEQMRFCEIPGRPDDPWRVQDEF